MKQNSDKWQKICMKLDTFFRVICIVIAVVAAAVIRANVFYDTRIKMSCASTEIIHLGTRRG